jgi:hypothetical protein
MTTKWWLDASSVGAAGSGANGPRYGKIVLSAALIGDASSFASPVFSKKRREMSWRDGYEWSLEMVYDKTQKGGR